MSDLFNNEFSNMAGKPQLDSDYWKKDPESAEKSESYNLFDNLIKTNFNLKEIKDKSVFEVPQDKD